MVGVGATVSGSSHAEIAVANEIGGTDYIGVEAELSANVTLATVKLGGTFGAGYGHTWSWFIGSEMTYGGTVGDIHPAYFADEHFNYGLYCYWHRIPGTEQAFQVINYWTE